jgi:hypothetical protein
MITVATYGEMSAFRLFAVLYYEMRKIKDPAKEISVNDFFKYCADMQDKIRQFGPCTTS